MIFKKKKDIQIEILFIIQFSITLNFYNKLYILLQINFILTIVS
jgi:hypothetical protein